MKEIWKDIEGYEGLYQVSNLGHVRSLDRTLEMKNGVKRPYKGRLLAPAKQNNGYLKIQLGAGTKNQKILHRVVAQAFIPNEKGLPDVNHKDGKKDNNQVDNLEWMSRSDNIKHGYETYLMTKGEQSYQAKLTEVQAKFILKQCKPFDEDFGFSQLAQLFQVSRQAVENVYHGRSWKHLQEYRSTTIENTPKSGSE